MEKIGEFHDTVSHHTRKLSIKKCKKIRKSERKDSDGSIRGTELLKLSEKLRKLSVIQKYRSAYLKKYVFGKGVKKCRRPKNTYVIPVLHVRRRPDNPFNVKNIVANLRKDQSLDSLEQLSVPNQHIDKEICYSSLEKTVGKLKNWESIRYKHQLDYKEKLKMERDNFLKDYTERKKRCSKQQTIDNIRSFYQSLDGPRKYTSEMPRNAIITKEHLVGQSVQRNSRFKTVEHLEAGENEVLERRHQLSAVTGRTNISEESMKYYHTEVNSKNSCESVDLTKDYETSVSNPRSDIQEMRLVRNDSTKRANNLTEVKRSEALNSADTSQATFYQSNEIPKHSRHEGFDFTIPFNESNILIKVMTPEGKSPRNSNHRSSSLLQDSLQSATETKQKLNAPKRVSFEQETKTDTIQPDADPENQWIQYIQNIITKNCDPKTEFVNKKITVNHSRVVAKPVETTHTLNQTNEPMSKEYVDHRYIQTTKPSQPPSIMKINSTAPPIPPATNYFDPPRIRQDRPTIPNPRIIRPKVLHPNPYFRSDLLRNNSQYSEHLDEPVNVTLNSLPQYPPLPQISEQSTIPHMEYIYSTPTTNYHPEYNMVSSRRIPLDIPHHPSVIGQPIFPPYEQTFMQYRNDAEQIQPPIDSYIPHNMHVPQLNINPSLGFLPPRPTAPGVYRYLNPAHIHPVWYYPHMLER